MEPVDHYTPFLMFWTFWEFNPIELPSEHDLGMLGEYGSTPPNVSMLWIVGAIWGSISSFYARFLSLCYPYLGVGSI